MPSRISNTLERALWRTPYARDTNYCWLSTPSSSKHLKDATSRLQQPPKEKAESAGYISTAIRCCVGYRCRTRTKTTRHVKLSTEHLEPSINAVTKQRRYQGKSAIYTRWPMAVPSALSQNGIIITLHRPNSSPNTTLPVTFYLSPERSRIRRQEVKS